MKNIKIAMLDSGIDKAHNIFRGMAFRQYRLINCAWSLDDAFTPKQGHGTAIASILIQQSKQIQLDSYVLFEEKLSTSPQKLIELLNHLQNMSYDIIHMSFGIRHYSFELEEICNSLREKGVLLVSAFDNIGSMSFPAALESVIGVDASYRCIKADDFVYVENSTTVNVKAKGGNQRVPWLNNGYMIIQGASFAAAYVTAYLIGLLQREIEFDAVLPHIRAHAKHIYEYSLPAENPPNTISQITKAAIFPCNKETLSLVRFYDLLPFQLIGIYDIKLSGNVGKKINAFGDDTVYNVQSLDKCEWDLIDTMIIGHTRDLEKLVKNPIRQKVLHLCLEHNVNVFCFDEDNVNESKPQFYPKSLWIDFPTMAAFPTGNKFGKLYQLKSPVLEILGTSSQQGKFTLQLQLRKRFVRDGYDIQQLGSEPESKLFGMDFIYPFGFNGTVQHDNLQSIEYLNYCMYEMDKRSPDIILVGSQSGTWPMLYNNLMNYPLDRISFLLGTQPDAIVLCINFHDRVKDIVRTIQGIESLIRGKVIACSLFPIGYKDDWDIVRGVKKAIAPELLKIFRSDVENQTGVPCHILDTAGGPESIYQEVIRFFSRETL